MAGGGWDDSTYDRRDAHRHLTGHTPGCASMHRDSCTGMRCSVVDPLDAGNAAVGAAMRVAQRHRTEKGSESEASAATSAHGHNVSTDVRLECDGDWRLN